MKMRGMMAAKSVDERTTPAMPGGTSSFPVRPHNHVETRLAAILQSELTNLVGAGVVDRKGPKAVTKVGRLNNNGLLLKREKTQPVHHVLVRVGNEFLGGIGIIGQHRQLVIGATHTALLSKTISGNFVSSFRWLYT